ncbi:MAG: AgmX/PglI C-terminal domain-containing protein [Deltaproteobacteria bacterium]|nr:AgmX/PglI C-terminal domain-containing protein [Deltaproteobacteria bacterium]
MRNKTFLLSSLFLAVAVSASALAGPPATHRSRDIVRLYGGEAHKVPKGNIVAVLANTVFILGEKLAIQKVFRFDPVHVASAGAPDHVEVVDLDADGEAEILITGKPTYVVDMKGEPKFHVADRCDEVYVYKHTVEAKSLVLCSAGNRVQVWRWDGQRLWEMSFAKKSQVPTRFSFKDFDGDEQPDVEFELLRARKAVYRVAGAAGRSIGEYSEREAPFEDLGARRAKQIQSELASKLDVDFGGDGKIWKVVLDGGTLRLFDHEEGVRGSFKVPGGKVSGMVLADMGGGGKKNLVVAHGASVTLLDDAMQVVAAATIDPKSIARSTHVKLEAVHFQGFAEMGAVQKYFLDHLDDLKSCYNARLKKDGVARQGKFMVEGATRKDGSVSKVEKVFNALGYGDVESCLLGRLKRWRLPEPKEGTEGSFSATIFFSWRDEARGMAKK